MELLDAGGYTHAKSKGITEAEVRRLLRRINVTDADTHLLMGMVRKVLWKLRAGGKPGPKGAG
jgi:tRNA C32,U32 (ribose-2'-O)-methylase TrmJ